MVNKMINIIISNNTMEINIAHFNKTHLNAQINEMRKCLKLAYHIQQLNHGLALPLKCENGTPN